MIADDDFDPLRRDLSQLTVLTSDERRAFRVRERCHARLRRAPEPQRRLGPVVFTGLCVVYLAALALDVLRLRGML